MIDILVPTFGRPDLLQPLLENINASTLTPHRTCFLAEPDDEETLKALDGLRGKHWFDVVAGMGSCAAALNEGFSRGEGQFVFTGNDDLWFHEGWDKEALLVDQPFVGTNDGNGKMDSFALVHRQYVEEHGAVFDQPGALVHEYISQFPDTELAEYAKARKVWGEAPAAITEHRHWTFGKADADHPNYEKARQTWAEDEATYNARRSQWQAQLS